MEFRNPFFIKDQPELIINMVRATNKQIRKRNYGRAYSRLHYSDDMPSYGTESIESQHIKKRARISEGSSEESRKSEIKTIPCEPKSKKTSGVISI